MIKHIRTAAGLRLRAVILRTLLLSATLSALLLHGLFTVALAQGNTYIIDADCYPSNCYDGDTDNTVSVVADAECYNPYDPEEQIRIWQEMYAFGTCENTSVYNEAEILAEEYEEGLYGDAANYVIADGSTVATYHGYEMCNGDRDYWSIPEDGCPEE
jgi:hypothetical protein